MGTQHRSSDDGTVVRRRRPGGRSAVVRDAALTSTIDLIAERGLAGVTHHAVAKRAGVNPTTIYRRWPTISELVMDALNANSADSIPIPDTGSIRSDLTQVLVEVRDLITSQRGRALVNAMIGSPHDVDVASHAQSFWETRHSVVGEIVRRAVERGELPVGVDEQLILETAAAPLYFRIFIAAGVVDDDLIDRIVQLVMDGARQRTD
jgi:AcrR family transcriptional regulator